MGNESSAESRRSISAPSESARTSGVVTVVARQKSQAHDLKASEEQCLSKLSTFDVLNKNDCAMNHLPLSQLMKRFDDHSKQCAEAVAFDQNSLAQRIKEVDFSISRLSSSTAEKQRKLSKLTEQFGHIVELNSLLDRISVNISHINSSANELNRSLPPDLRLEPLNLSSDQ